MPLHIRLATEADIPAIARVGAAAFNPSVDVIVRNLFPSHLQPGGSHQDADFQIPYRVARKTAALNNSPNQVLMVAVDVDLDAQGASGDDIVGYSLWELPASQGDGRPKPQRIVLPNMDKEVSAYLGRVVTEGDEALLGERRKDVWYLDFLAVDPAHQRRGIGKLLLKWGIDRAADDHKDCYLIATPAGRPLYAASGFEEVGLLDMFGVMHAQMIIKNDPRWKD